MLLCSSDAKCLDETNLTVCKGKDAWRYSDAHCCCCKPKKRSSSAIARKPAPKTFGIEFSSSGSSLKQWRERGKPWAHRHACSAATPMGLSWAAGEEGLAACSTQHRARISRPRGIASGSGPDA
eukprot:6212048-Pleurochrysis_carterae.AAC.2